MLFTSAFVSAGENNEKAIEFLKQANTAMELGQPEKALSLANKAIKANPKYQKSYLARAVICQVLRKHEQAIADYTKLIKLNPKMADAYQGRGVEYFKAGKFEKSVEDFDHYLKLMPKRKPSHWQRGISCYYAGQYKEGKEQFEGYQKFDSNDVENAVWRYLCMVPLSGKESAQKEILKIGDDKRIPMRQIYEMFAGNLSPEKVMEKAKAGKPSKEQLNRRLFYAHLYLGLFYASDGKHDIAYKHLNTATKDHPIGHYMWDVARIARNTLSAKK